MEYSLQYAYVLATLLLVPVYLLFFIPRKDVRDKMLRFSLLGAVAGPISQWWYVRDYWHPEYAFGFSGLVEDLLFAFLVVGITVALPNVLLNTASVSDSTLGDKRSRYVWTLVILLGSLAVFTSLFGVNSIYASAIGFIILTLLVWRERPDLIKISVAGAVFWLCLATLSYLVVLALWPTFISSWWKWENITGVLFIGIPLEEFLWFGTWGLAGTVLYEWKKGTRLVPRGIVS